MSNSQYAIVAIVMLLAILVGTLGGCITRGSYLAEYNRINAPV